MEFWRVRRAFSPKVRRIGETSILDDNPVLGEVREAAILADERIAFLGFHSYTQVFRFFADSVQVFGREATSVPTHNSLCYW